MIYDTVCAISTALKQGAISIEILEQNPDIDTIVVPIGGGGLSTGIAVAAVMVEILNEQL